MNEKSNIIAVVNTKEHVALAIDITNHLVAVFNGTSGSAIIINTENETGIMIKASKDLWLFKNELENESFEIFITKLSSLKVIWEIGSKVGTQFSFSSVEVMVLEEIAAILIHLSAEWAAQLKSNVSNALNTLVRVSQKLFGLFKGSLKGFLKLLGTGVAVLYGDFLWFVGVLEGFALFFSEFQGGIGALIEKSIRFDLKLIFAAASGVELFVYIVGVLKKHFDISVILGTVLTSIEKFLHLLVVLGGKSYRGVNGLITVIYNLIGVVHKNVAIEEFIDSLLKYALSGNIEKSISEEWSKSLEVLITLLKEINVSGSLHNLLTALIELKENRFIINGFKLSDVILVLLSVGAVAYLDFVIHVLLLISAAAVEAELLISQLFLVILGYLSSSGHLVLLLIPEIESMVSSGNITEEITKKIDTQYILAEGQDISSILSRIPVIGKIYESVSASLTKISKGVWSLEKILHSSKARKIVERIEEWISSVLHITLTGEHSSNSSSSSGGQSGSGHSENCGSTSSGSESSPLESSGSASGSEGSGSENSWGSSWGVESGNSVGSSTGGSESGGIGGSGSDSSGSSASGSSGSEGSSGGLVDWSWSGPGNGGGSSGESGGGGSKGLAGGLEESSASSGGGSASVGFNSDSKHLHGHAKKHNPGEKPRTAITFLQSSSVFY